MSQRPPPPCYWVRPDNYLIEVTIVNSDPYDSGTRFTDIQCVGEVVRFYCIGNPNDSSNT